MAEAVATPFEMTLGDGTVVKGANIEEAFNALAKMKVDTANALRQQREESARLQQETEQLRGEITKKNTPPPEPGKFNSQKYYELLNQDPDAANSYWFEHKFGVRPEDMVQQYQQTQQQVSALTQQAVSAAFWAQHAEDFPGGAEPAKLLTRRVEQLMGQGFNYSLDTVNYAYSKLIEEGSIKPVEKEPETPTITPNPSLSGGGNVVSESEIQKVEQMSDADLEKLLRSKGMLK